LNDESCALLMCPIPFGVALVSEFCSFGGFHGTIAGGSRQFRILFPSAICCHTETTSAAFRRQSNKRVFSHRNSFDRGVGSGRELDRDGIAWTDPGISLAHAEICLLRFATAVGSELRTIAATARTDRRYR